MSGSSEDRRHALRVVRDQLAEAIAARKCHACGCLHKTVEALAGTDAAGELRDAFAAARAVYEPKRYDCLGCAVCYPAIAANAYSEVFPEPAAGLDLCPTETPEERTGWPPLPGAFRVVRYRAPVAVCVLNSDGLGERLAALAPDGLAIVGTMQTENLGIERLVRNVLANPHVRHLVLCGEDTRQAIGHLPGQSLESLFVGGLDERGRIRGANGKRPVIKNVTREQIATFVRQIELVSMIGEMDEQRIARVIEERARRGAAPFAEAAPEAALVEPVEAAEPRRLIPDPAGFLVVYPERRAARLVVEHYSSEGVLDCVIEGRTPAAVYSEIIARALIGRLDHAAYLGRELARAERSLETGEPYVQDRAAGEIVGAPVANGCGCPDRNAFGGKS